MATTRTPRKSDISRTLGRILGKDTRDAAGGWDVVNTSTGPMITLNYFTDTDDRNAFDKVDAALGTRYRLTFTPVLGDYDELPEQYKYCAVIELRPLPQAEDPQETPAMPATDFPKHYTATGPDRRRLTRGAEISENGRVASFVRVASATEILVEWSWLNRREIIAADRVGVTITANGPQEPREVLSTDHRRCEHRKNVTADHAPACPVYADGLTAEHCTCHYSDARCEEQQQTATPVAVEWTKTVHGHHNGTATINGTTYQITHISHADPKRGALGDHLAHLPAADGRMGAPLARTWGLADLLGALADHAGATPGPLALTETGRNRLTRR